MNQCSRFACYSRFNRQSPNDRNLFHHEASPLEISSVSVQHAIVRMKAGDTRAEFWSMNKINSKSTEKSLISMHTSHLNNSVEMPFQTRYFPCAGTFGDPKNRLPRHAQSSTLHSVYIKYIYDMFARFLALVGFQRCVTFEGLDHRRIITLPVLHKAAQQRNA